MKNLKSFLIIFILIAISGCSNSRQVKTKPDDVNNWKICHVCHGSGTVISSTSDKPADDVSNNPANKNSCCLGFADVTGFFFSVDDPNDPAENHGDYSRNIPERNLEIMKDNVPQRSTVEKRVKCPYCNGIGWLKIESADSPPAKKKFSSPVINKNIKIIENDGIIEYK